jgi:methylglutaconyl-CoA hydratase
VERKIGTAAFSQLAIDAASFRNAEWAKEHGLFAETYPTMEAMDESIAKLTASLSQSNPEAMAEMKKIFWKGTENWDVLLEERAAISGRLVVSEFTRSAIAAFKKKA